MSFFERFLQKKFDLREEINNINELLEMKCGNFSIENEISFNFLNWPLRRTYVNFDDFMEKEGLNKVFELAYNEKSINLEQYVDLVEVIMSLLNYFQLEIRSFNSYKALIENISKVIDSLNFEIRYINSIHNCSYAICVPKDFKVTEAAEIVDDENLAEKIYLFKYRKMKGNIYEKAIILSRLFMYFEGIRSNLQKNNFAGLCRVIGELSDKLNVRHKPKGYEELVVKELEDEELESTYDKLFETYLTAIVINQYFCNKEQLEEIRNKFNKKH